MTTQSGSWHLLLKQTITLATQEAKRIFPNCFAKYDKSTCEAKHAINAGAGGQ